MKIAVTSQNFRTVTGHAGKSRRFLVFELQPGAEPREVKRLDLPRELAFHDFNGEGPHPVDGSDVLITQSCGEGFTRRLAARGIRVVVTAETDPVKAALAVVTGAPLPPPDMRSHQHQHRCAC
jgi:predicted Fe-Mo cluster-binding NifX family protein